LRWLRKATPDLGEAQKSLEHIVDAAHHANRAIEAIRTMFKKHDQEKVPFNVNGLIEEVLAFVAGDLRRRGILVDTRLRTDLPEITANRVQLQQVLLNLIGNAVDAMLSVTDRDRVLKVTSARQHPSNVLITIEDSGPGIESQNIERIFEPFYTTKFDGTGMGLSICRSIVQEHGGRLFATPGPSCGLAMQISLPASATDAAQKVGGGVADVVSA
jgi:signal transduction histidine kinase